MKHSNKQSNQARDEKLSALLDNALSDQQLDEFMQDLKRDPIADAETAQRYRLMGDAMRDELDQSSFMDISSAVHRAIENEPSLNESEVAFENTQASSPLSGLLQIFNNWTKPVAGMAVAASVAMVTLLTFNTVNNNDAVDSTIQVAQTQPASTSPQRVNPDIARNVRMASTLDTSKSKEQQKQLNEYMLQHSGYASQSTMQGMMPYVRAADVKTQEKD